VALITSHRRCSVVSIQPLWRNPASSIGTSYAAAIRCSWSVTGRLSVPSAIINMLDLLPLATGQVFLPISLVPR
jgi:hypothetical protein